MPPTLLVPVVPTGWIHLSGPDHAILAELDPADPRLLHLRAALDSGRFDDALSVLGRSGPPTAVAASVDGSAVRVVTSLGAYAEALVGGRRRELRSDPRLGWSDVTLHDAASVALLPPPSAFAAAVPDPAGVRAMPEVAAPVAPVAPDVVLAPLPPARAAGTSPAPSPAGSNGGLGSIHSGGRAVIDHVPWATGQPPAQPAPAQPPPAQPAPAPPMPTGAAGAPAPPAPPIPGPVLEAPVVPAPPGSGWVPAAPVSRTYTPYAVPLPSVTTPAPVPEPPRVEPAVPPAPEPATPIELALADPGPTQAEPVGPEFTEPEAVDLEQTDPEFVPPGPVASAVAPVVASVVAPAVAPAPPVLAAPAPRGPEPAPTAAYPIVLDPADDPEAFDATIDRSALLAAAGAPHAPSGVSVLAVLCPAGHVSPPHSITCRTCGREVPAQEPFSTPRPPLGVLRLSTGDLVTLDRGVLLGRAPQVEPGLPVAQRPHVVRVASPQRDVSRTHLEVILEGWHVLVRDLATTNGTTVTLPGREPVRLLPHDQQVIEPGTLVSLADEVTFTFEIAG